MELIPHAEIDGRSISLLKELQPHLTQKNRSSLARVLLNILKNILVLSNSTIYALQCFARRTMFSKSLHQTITRQLFPIVRKYRESLECGLYKINNDFYSTFSKRSIDTPQTGQTHVSGKSSKGVPGATSEQGSPFLGS